MKYFAFILLPVVFFLECASMQKNIKALEKCQVSLKDIRINEFKAFGKKPGIRFRVILDVFNPNDFPVELNHFNLKLSKNVNDGKDLTLANIKSSAQLAIPPMETRTVEVDIETEKEEGAGNFLHAVLETIHELMQNKKPVFDVEGIFKINSMFGNISLPVKFSKEVKL